VSANLMTATKRTWDLVRSNPVTDTRRCLTVKHLTRYRYSQPIQQSKHCLHLRPIDDVYQSVASYHLVLVPQVPVTEFEDVFGNWASRFEIRQPTQN